MECVFCINHAPPNPQEGRTPLIVASGAGHLPVAKLLLETHRNNVNKEDSRVSGWEVMGGISEQLPYAIVLDSFHMNYSKVDQTWFIGCEQYWIVLSCSQQRQYCMLQGEGTFLW